MTPSPSSFTQTDPSNAQQETYPSARVVFDFTPTSPFELSVTGERLCALENIAAHSHIRFVVSEGTLVHILEEDDGSGWVKVIDETGQKGLVPGSYVQLVDAASQHPELNSSGSARQQGSKTQGEEGLLPRSKNVQLTVLLAHL